MAYPNLAAEMARHQIAAKEIAVAVGKTPDTVNNWLRGKGEFPVGKAFIVQKCFFPDMPIAYLFATEPIRPQTLTVPPKAT